jgi:hypothetical protein
MYIREHRRSFKVTVGKVLVSSILAMRQTKLILEITFNPHLTNDILVQRRINRRPVFDNKSRGYTDPIEFQIRLRCKSRIIPRQMRAVKTTVDQKVMLPNRTVTSSLKSGVEKKEYTIIHKSMTRVDPTTTIQVMTVQLKKE